MINRNRLGAILAASALVNGGIAFAVDVSEETYEERRKQPPPQPRTFTPEPVVTEHDRERIRRAEMKRARRALRASARYEHSPVIEGERSRAEQDPSPPNLSQGA